MNAPKAENAQWEITPDINARLGQGAQRCTGGFRREKSEIFSPLATCVAAASRWHDPCKTGCATILTMKTTHCLTLPAGLLISSLAFGADTPSKPVGNRPADVPPAMTPPAARPNENASDNAKAVHVLLDQFKTQREQFIASRKALLEKLKSATGDDRKAILDELRADQQSRVEEQRAMGKEIRDEVKKLREQKKN